MKSITAALAAAALSCLTFAQADAAGTVTDSVSIMLQRSGVTLTEQTDPKRDCPAPTTAAECDACMDKMIDAELARRTTGYVTYKCLDVSQSFVKFTKPPTCTSPKPADEERPGQCPSGTTGAWTQKLQYQQAAYPDCWKPGEWTPASAPAGICATPQTLVYACPEAGADGRVLESATVTWPNCAGAGYQAPSKSLVVAVNPGAQPLMWRLASKLTDEKIWTQTGTVGAWTKASAVDWGASTPSPGIASVTLSWTPPTQNTDGTSLTNLAGYRVVYGTSSTMLDKNIEIPNPGVTSYLIEQLAPATWYFAVKAYNANGAESIPSNIASKVIP